MYNGGLSLPCDQSMFHFVGKLFAMGHPSRTNLVFYPSEFGESIHVIACIMGEGMETIKNGRLGLQAKVCE